jgi:hypothetical protein
MERRRARRHYGAPAFRPAAPAGSRVSVYSIAMRFVSVLLLSLSLVSQSFATPQPVTLFLAKYMHFSRSELQALEEGKVVAKSINTDLTRELAFIGVTHVNAKPSSLITQFRDIETFKKAEAVLKVKKLSDPPAREDFDGLKIETDDIKAIKKCKPGKCGLKLSADMISDLQNAMDQGKGIQSVYQDVLYSYVQAYTSRGNTALCEYNDEKKVVSLLEEFKGILSNSSYLKDEHPELYDHLRNDKPLDRTEKFIYWSKETLGFRPVVSMTEVTIYTATPQNVVIISKQIYANHYMDGSLAITLVMADQDLEHPGFYMMYVNRSRTDMLGGLLGGLKRSIAKSRSTSALKENLQLIKQRLEESEDK